jgi:hypothetical protein
MVGANTGAKQGCQIVYFAYQKIWEYLVGLGMENILWTFGHLVYF